MGGIGYVASRQPRIPIMYVVFNPKYSEGSSGFVTFQGIDDRDFQTAFTTKSPAASDLSVSALRVVSMVSLGKKR